MTKSSDPIINKKKNLLSQHIPFSFKSHVIVFYIRMHLVFSILNNRSYFSFLLTKTLSDLKGLLRGLGDFTTRSVDTILSQKINGKIFMNVKETLLLLSRCTSGLYLYIRSIWSDMRKKKCTEKAVYMCMRILCCRE